MKANSTNEVPADGSIDTEVREHHAPLAEVWIGHASFSETEYLLIGEVHERAVESLPEPIRLPLTRIPVKRRSADELISWIRSDPAELGRALETQPSDLHILEWYPPTPGVTPGVEMVGSTIVEVDR